MQNVLGQMAKAYPDVKTAVVIGQDQFEIALLTEPALKCSDTADSIEKVCAHIDSADIHMDRFAVSQPPC